MPEKTAEKKSPRCSEKESFSFGANEGDPLRCMLPRGHEGWHKVEERLYKESVRLEWKPD